MKIPLSQAAIQALRAMSPEEMRDFILYCAGLVDCVRLYPETFDAICQRILDAEIQRLAFGKSIGREVVFWKS